jgi:hypothetical protein
MARDQVGKTLARLVEAPGRLQGLDLHRDTGVGFASVHGWGRVSCHVNTPGRSGCLRSL